MTVDVRQFVRVERAGAGNRIGHQRYSAARRVFPELAPLRERIGREVERPVDISHIGREAAVRTVRAGAGPNVGDHHCAGRGAVRLPKLLAVRAVIPSEVENAVDDGERAEIRDVARRSWTNVFDEHRLRGGSVASPELIAVHPVISGEHQQGVHQDHLAGRGERASCTCANVFYKRRPSFRSISLPKLRSVRAVVGDEVELAAHHPQQAGIGRVGTRLRAAAPARRVLVAAGVNVFHHHCAGFRTVRLPQLASIHAVVGHEVQRAIVVGQLSWAGGRRRGASVGEDILHHRRAAARAVGSPQLDAGGAVSSGEEQLAADVGQLRRIRRVGEVLVVDGVRPGEQVAHHLRASDGPVSAPQFVAVGAVIGGEVEYAVDVRQIGRIRRPGADVDVG